MFNLQEREKEGEPKMNDTRAAGREVGAGAAADRQAWFTLVEADRASETRVLEGRPSCCDTAEEEERWAEVWVGGRASVLPIVEDGGGRIGWTDRRTRTRTDYLVGVGACLAWRAFPSPPTGPPFLLSPRRSPPGPLEPLEQQSAAFIFPSRLAPVTASLFTM